MSIGWSILTARTVTRPASSRLNVAGASGGGGPSIKVVGMAANPLRSTSDPDVGSGSDRAGSAAGAGMARGAGSAGEAGAFADCIASRSRDARSSWRLNRSPIVPSTRAEAATAPELGSVTRAVSRSWSPSR